MTETLKALIVDDEPPARNQMRRLLADFPEIAIQGEASRFSEAKALIDKINFDVVFLDVQLFGQNGFDLLPLLKPSTQVVFVTAFDEFAIRAFEVNALDYLVKPVRPERLAVAVQRLKQFQWSNPVSLPEKKLTEEDLIFLNEGGQKRFVQLTSICYITAEGEYSEVHFFEGASSLIRKPLKNWETDLPPETFIRIHRNAIINLNFIEKVERLPGGRANVFMKKTSRPFETSRRLTPEFEKRVK